VVNKAIALGTAALTIRCSLRQLGEVRNPTPPTVQQMCVARALLGEWEPICYESELRDQMDECRMLG